MHPSTLLTLLITLTSSFTILAYPHPGVSHNHFAVLALRASTTVNPAAVTDTECTNQGSIVFHDQNVAELAICGGIAGSITKCAGAPPSTTGQSGTALFTLNAVDSGATINISKGRWEGCVRAASAVCPTGGYSSTCVGGASTGDVKFTLAQT